MSFLRREQFEREATGFDPSIRVAKQHINVYHLATVVPFMTIFDIDASRTEFPLYNLESPRK